MSVADSLAARNSHFASTGFTAGLRMMPSLRTIVIACVDPRVVPEEMLGLATGEAAVIRNVGGRVTAGVLDELAILRGVTQAAGGDLGAGWELVVLQHTDCGITRVADRLDEMAAYFGVSRDQVAAKRITAPHDAVACDLAVLAADPRLGSGIASAGLVYDVSTGLVETVRPGP